MSTQPKWVLVTGVSEGGMGDALVHEFTARGFNVIATALDLSQLAYLKSPSPPTALRKLQLDVTNSASIAEAVAEAKQITNGHLDILINNAGYGYMMPFLDCDIELVKRNFDVNVFGLLAVTQAFFTLLREAKGMVVNQCSIAGLPANYQPFIGSYEASKSAAVKMSDVLRVELEPFDVKVVTLMTGAVETPFWTNAQGAHIGLPSGSVYSPIKDKVEAMMKGETNPPGLDTPQQWAKKAVNDLLKPRTPLRVRRGFLAERMWIVNWLMPFWVLDWLFSKTSGLVDLKKIVKGGQKRVD